MTEETKVETNEEKQLESFENPFAIEPFATPPILVFKYSDDVVDLKKRALQVPFSDMEAGLVQSEESKVLHNVPEFKELKEFIKDAIIFPELKVDPDEIKLSGIISLNGEDAYEIIWSNNKKVYYATSDYHKIKEVQSSEIQGKLMNITKTYSNYQSVEGILFPQKITQNMGSQKINFKVNSISLNEQLSEDEFE